MSVFGAAEDIDAAVKVVMAEEENGSGRGKITIEIICEKKEAMPYLVQAFNEMMSKLSAGACPKPQRGSTSMTNTNDKVPEVVEITPARKEMIVKVSSRIHEMLRAETPNPVDGYLVLWHTIRAFEDTYGISTHGNIEADASTFVAPHSKGATS